MPEHLSCWTTRHEDLPFFLLGLFLLLLYGSELLVYINTGPINFGYCNLVFGSETLGSQRIVKMYNDVESHSCKM